MNALSRSDFSSWLNDQSLASEVRRHLHEIYDIGFTVVKNVVGAAGVTRLIADYESVVIPFWQSHASKYQLPERIVRLTQSHTLLPAVRDVFETLKTPLAIADAALGSKTCLFSSQFYKYSSRSNLHLDTPAFHSEPAHSCMAIWLALEETHAENGPLQLIPYGHRVPAPAPRAFAKEILENLDECSDLEIWKHVWEPYAQAMVDSCLSRGLKVEQIHLSPGDVLMWHPNMPHGATPELNPQLTRRSIGYQVTPVGTPVYRTDVYFKETQMPSTWNKSYKLHGERYYIDEASSFTLRRKQFLGAPIALANG